MRPRSTELCGDGIDLLAVSSNNHSPDSPWAFSNNGSILCRICSIFMAEISSYVAVATKLSSYCSTEDFLQRSRFTPYSENYVLFSGPQTAPNSSTGIYAHITSRKSDHDDKGYRSEHEAGKRETERSCDRRRSGL